MIGLPLQTTKLFLPPVYSFERRYVPMAGSSKHILLLLSFYLQPKTSMEVTRQQTIRCQKNKRSLPLFISLPSPFRGFFSFFLFMNSFCMKTFSALKEDLVIRLPGFLWCTASLRDTQWKQRLLSYLHLSLP